MKKIQYIQIFAATLLVACNSNRSGTTINNTPLSEYKSMLLYTPPTSQQVKSTSNNQQSFTVESDTTFSSIDIKFFSNNSCKDENGGLQTTITLNGNGGVTFPAGTYSSTGMSNYSLCERYTGGCPGLYNNFISNIVKSMRFDYNYAPLSGGPGTVMGGCMSGSIDSSNKEAILNWNNNSPWAACINGSNCGFSQAYSVNLPSSYNPWSQLGSIPSAGYFFSIIQESGNIYASGYSSTQNPAGGVWVWNGTT